MSLDLLKERFGHSISTDKKEVDKKKLNEMFNSNPMGKLESFKAQHQGELEEKDRIIENLESEASNLANQVLNLEKEKSNILNELNQSKWLENNIASTTKKIYEDKIKKMTYVDSSELIPMLIEVSRKKQGNQKLNWGNWLEIPENIYLFQINESIAKKVFEDTNVLIDRKIGLINERRTRAGDEPTKNYSLTFTGDTAATGTGDHVVTTFDPIEHELYNGFTISYWVRADEIPVATHLFAIGRRNANSKERFTFGMNNATRLYLGVGQQKKTSTNHGMEVGNWYHWVVTFAGGVNGTLIAYRNGEDVDLASDGNGTSTWDDTASDEPIFFGGRNLIGSYNNGWACSLDEVAIFDEVKDSDWVTSTYNSTTNADLRGQSGLVVELL